MKQVRKRLPIVLGIIIGVIVACVLIYAATPLSTCQYSERKVTNIVKEKINSSNLDTSHVQYVNATDHIKLAYQSYAPTNPKAVVIFYHGSGANSRAGYQPIGEQLSQNYGIATYLPDIRGHGMSGGDRGDTPSMQQVYNDITSMIETAHREFPSVPVFLGGHSAGAGLVINYFNSPHHANVDGYLFIAPDFGTKSHTMREGFGDFASVCTKAFVINKLSGGILKGHEIGVRYNYPEESMKSNIGLIQYVSVNMALALNPSNPSKEFANIDKPFGIWIGSEDEIMLPKKIIDFANQTKIESLQSHIEIVPGEKHITILNNIAKKMGPWILQSLPHEKMPRE
ncbi:alpha/beta fold hydrolase [Bacillus thuringiensis]|uniref:alpha/beta fold hydrolase n=1 Tax=Bacillus thuringiensis TaxID=1428 RepID=UPI001298DAE7|nr:alpha/beta fold hydrolase [Bacillus thuringiensis]MEB8931918.1 alpha/beta fold hydrolase [Bacillus cereus]MCR6790115.1 alpha/beta fold hydrolase [Bacillus thuringiensis]MCR6820590.1 alpha/beta fold hydrolase [Bacillus thuringiensis]MCR6832015.1 alpha/beta fold hydrolase [Bacillus thuringiensis]MEB9915067.1 alpha/beta fold hydrolase [Bacillus cereus]